jgi:transcriptional antiterminator
VGLEGLLQHRADINTVFEDKALADNVVIAVEKQIHYASNENLAREVQDGAQNAEAAERTPVQEKTVEP